MVVGISKQLLRPGGFRGAGLQRLLEVRVLEVVWQAAGVVEELPEGNLRPGIGGGFGRSERSFPMVSFRESAPLLTKESATAPLKALEVLAMRMRLPARMGRPHSMLRTPKARTSLCWPRWITAMTPGGPPFMVTSLCNARSSAASALSARFLPKAALLPAR